MADRPLRPATRRCLGRPLPHQLADRPRDPPRAPEHFLSRPCDHLRASGISQGFPWLSRSPGQVSHVLLTRSPLDHWTRRSGLVRLACVRHAASVRPEPGSNSPSRSRARPEPNRRSVCPVSHHREVIAWETVRSESRSRPGWPRPRLTRHRGAEPVRWVSPDLGLTDIESRVAKPDLDARTRFCVRLFRFQGAVGALEAPGTRRSR